MFWLMGVLILGVICGVNKESKNIDSVYQYKFSILNFLCIWVFLFSDYVASDLINGVSSHETQELQKLMCQLSLLCCMTLFPL